MANMIRDGLSRMQSLLRSYGSEEAMYIRGDQKTAIHVIAGRSDLIENEDLPASIISRLRDFFIDANEVKIIPKNGDVIEIGVRRFEVLSIGGVSWRWCDPYGISMRVHTKETG